MSKMRRAAWGFDLVPEDEWRVQAACSPATADLFWPSEYKDGTDRPKVNRNMRLALELCAACPVRVQCLSHELANPQPWTRIAAGHVITKRGEVYVP